MSIGLGTKIVYYIFILKNNILLLFNMNGLKRIQKEYKDLTLNPIENIIITPESDNIYIWHYVILGNVLPYKNGHYYGKLTLHEDYPMKAPQIIMITPNGRFKTNTRLCFSMSDYHQETWSPNWNIRTIMIGFYSFMLEESSTEGSINCTYDERRIALLTTLTSQSSVKYIFVIITHWCVPVKNKIGTNEIITQLKSHYE